MKRKEISNKINNQKNENIDLIIITVIVGLGVNILATALINSLPIKYNIYYLLIIGIALSLFVLFIYIIIKIKSLKTEVEIRSNFIFNNDIKDFIIIPDYIVTNDMQKYIYSLLKESKKFNKKYLNSEYIKTGNKESLNKEDDDFKNIINELIEYLILDKLAMTSIDFYNIFDKISIYNIDNLPSSIKENGFLKTFTKEIKKRKEFHREDVMVAKIEKILDNENSLLVSAQTADGYIYEMFELYLPKNTKIYKNYKNQIIIENKLYKITIEWLFDYYGGIIDNEFFEYIIKKNRDWDKDDDFCFNLNIDIKFKPFFVFNKYKQRHYEILDLIVENLIEYFDYDNYLEKINWHLVKTICKYNKREL